MATHDEILSLLGCDDLQQLVPPQFLDRFGLNQPEQYGMVCQDVAKNMRILEDAGSSQFLHMKQTIKRWTEGGNTHPAKLEAAMGYSNGQQIELLGAGEGTQLYTDVIPDDGSIKLHHVCIFQNGIDAIEADLNAAGYPTHVSLEVGVRGLYSIRVKYFDTCEELGFWLEVGQYITLWRHAPMGEKLITRLAALQALAS